MMLHISFLSSVELRIVAAGLKVATSSGYRELRQVHNNLNVAGTMSISTTVIYSRLIFSAIFGPQDLGHQTDSLDNFFLHYRSHL